MNSRYEIQDILAQDASGVVFRAHDRESDHNVVLRRFFPFGVDGGGLEGEERIAYDIAVRRLMKVEHPALRRVVDGGSDPVDGIPFLVTEWHEGEPLAERLKIRPLSPPSAKALADLALECSQILSEAFQEETIWIETEANSVILGEASAERKVTFWISPLRWLGDADARRGLQPIVDMVEHVTGWKESVIPDQAGDGLGWWFKTLRKNPEQWNLSQAREALHQGPPIAKPTATVQGSPKVSQPTGAQTIPAARHTLPMKNPTVIWPWIAAGVLATSALAFVGWQAMQQRKGPPPLSVGMETADQSPVSERDAAAIASARATKMAEDIQSGKTLLSPTIGELFTVEGTISELRQSRSGKTTYLTIQGDQNQEIVALRYRMSSETIELPKLQELVGLKFRITGKVAKESSGLMIDLIELDQIEPFEE